MLPFLWNFFFFLNIDDTKTDPRKNRKFEKKKFRKTPEDVLFIKEP